MRALRRYGRRHGCVIELPRAITCVTPLRSHASHARGCSRAHAHPYAYPRITSNDDGLRRIMVGVISNGAGPSSGPPLRGSCEARGSRFRRWANLRDSTPQTGQHPTDGAPPLSVRWSSIQIRARDECR